MKNHFRNWGAVYILAILWLISALLQYVFMLPEIEKEGMAVYWAATFENHQSEYLQLVFQCLLVVALADRLFKKSKEDVGRLEHKLDRLLEENEELRRNRGYR